MAEYSGIERRLVFRLLDYWERKKEGRKMPCMDDILSSELADDWDWCFLISLGDEGENAVFTHVGSLIYPTERGDLRGIEVSNCPEETLIKQATAFMPRVLELGVPVSIGGECEDGGDTLLYRSTLMPLSSDDVFVDALFGGANCRKVTNG
ncbi:MAG: PAS domain-containing protein [Halopseudomonas aestusnigri]